MYQFANTNSIYIRALEKIKQSQRGLVLHKRAVCCGFSSAVVRLIGARWPVLWSFDSATHDVLENTSVYTLGRELNTVYPRYTKCLENKSLQPECAMSRSV